MTPTTGQASQLMTIGRFAQLSGLSVKALRHYDETGLLDPARVDSETGYRWYSAGQARRGATISVLRSMGVPLDTVRRIVSEPDLGEQHLARWQADLAAERTRQDAAVAAGLAALDAYGRETNVVRRTVPEQHYLGVALDSEVLEGHPEAGAALMEAGWEDLGRVVADAGGTVAMAWTTIRPQEGRDPGQVLLCLGLDQPWTAGPPTHRHEAGSLPVRTELAVVLTPDGMPSSELQPGDAAPPAAFVALMEALDRDGATPGTIRQMPLLDEVGGFTGLEVSVTLVRPA